MVAEHAGGIADVNLDRTVLRELLSKNRPIESHFRSRYKHGDSNESEEQAARRKRFFEEDKDWQDIQFNLENSPSGHVEPVPLYDAERGTIYHANDYLRENPSEKETSDTHDGRTDAVPDFGPSDAVTQTAAKEILDRLSPVGGQFGPTGYCEWMARNLERRFPITNGRASDIPNYGNLCDQCLHMLTHSMVLYHTVLKHRIFWMPFSGMFREWSDYLGPQNEIFSHHETIHALCASAATGGCHLCSLLVAPLKPGHFHSYMESKAPYHITIEASAKITVHTPGITSRTVAIETTGCYREGPSTLKYQHTGAREVMLQVNEWLKDCLENHTERCVKPVGFLPSRLIKVTPSAQGSLSAKLVLRRDLCKNSRYLTLSHSWGNLVMPTLTTDTFDQFQSAIPVLALTKTFQEAFQATLELGHEYIWIDSLCILQDSKVDWEKEAAMMGLVYRHSTCTIAATGAENGSQGLFFHRNPLSFTHCPLFTDSKYSDYPSRFFARHYDDWPEPLIDRAWAVQEQVLPTRYIKYGSDRVTWSCRQTTLVEGPDTHQSGRGHSFSIQFATLLNKGSDNYDNCWGELVSFYSGRSLTYWTDKWPAFRGVATEVAIAQGRNLVHGLWYHQICNELLWEAQDPKRGTIDCGEPSWTWLNSKGRVRLPIMIENRMHGAAEISSSSPPLHEMFHQIEDDSGGVEKLADRMDYLEVVSSQFLERQSELDGNALEIMAITASCEFKGEKLYRQFSHPGELRYILELIVKQSKVPGQDQHIKGRWWPDSLPVQQLTQARLMHLVDKVERNRSYSTSGLVIIPVQGRSGYWRRLGKYQVVMDEDEGNGIRSWPWAGDKEAILLI